MTVKEILKDMSILVSTHTHTLCQAGEDVCGIDKQLLILH